MPERNFKVRALGEIAIRCTDKERMVAFYRDVIGLDLLNGAQDRITFFALGESFGGHTAVLALFPADLPERGETGKSAAHESGAGGKPETGAGSSLHHLALSLSYAEQEAVMSWYDRLGLDYRVEHFGWVGWRGVFTRDPDGNTVELVAKDPEWTGPARADGAAPGSV